MSYKRRVSVTDAITGEVTRVYEVKSTKPMSQKDAIHAVIHFQETGQSRQETKYVKEA